MKPISKAELQDQADSFVKERLAFLLSQENESNHKPRVRASEQEGILKALYMRFVARYREVRP